MRKTELQQKVVLMTWPSPRGIDGWSRFAASKRWRLEVLPPNGQAIKALASDPPDGVIAYLGSEKFAAWAAGQRFAVVNHSSSLRVSPVPRVCIDDRAAGRLAAEHFLSLGYRQLAYVGYAGPWFSAEREAGFVEAAQVTGVVPATYRVRVALEPIERQRSRARHAALVKFLRGLPEPVGVFACNDPLALWVNDAARDAGRHVPEDTAVLGMDDDPLCLLANPPLSSVASPTEAVAYRAAAMLDDLMAGRALPERDVRLAPQSVIARQSTDMLAIDDRRIAAAVRFLHQHFSESIAVDDIASVGGVSRRTLELGFRKYFDRTPLQELQRIRLQAAKRLLADHRLTLTEVADRAGFESYPWFMTFFGREVGETPGAYRKNRC